MDIKSRAGVTLYTSTATTLREAVVEAVAKDAHLRGAHLRGAHLHGAHLEGAHLEGAHLEDAYLEDAYLRGAHLEDAHLEDADLRYAHLEGADLRYADLEGADLEGAHLEDAHLEDADLRYAHLEDAYLEGAHLEGAHLEGAPVIPSIDAAILAAIDKPGNALDMQAWHTCETTHCRAGWAIHLAGEAGTALERRIGPGAAGALIYAASGSHPVPDFQASDEEAMADLRARAGA